MLVPLEKAKRIEVVSSPRKRPFTHPDGTIIRFPASWIATVRSGISSHVRPSSARPPAFGVRPPHCLKKKAVPNPKHCSLSDKTAMVVHGVLDALSPTALADAEALADALGADLQLLEGAGHLPLLSRADDVAELLDGFLARCQVSAGAR